MANLTIEELPSNVAESNDAIPMSRSGTTYQVSAQEIADLTVIPIPAQVQTQVTSALDIVAATILGFVTGTITPADGVGPIIGVAAQSVTSPNLVPVIISGTTNVVTQTGATIAPGDLVGSNSSGQAIKVTAAPYLGVCITGALGPAQVTVLVAPVNV